VQKCSLGNHWDYTSNLYPVSFEITDTTTINGLLYYGLSMWSGSEPEYWIRNDENTIYMFNIKDNKDYILFNFNAEVGQSWELPSGHECEFGIKIKLISKIDTIKTPVGEFLCYHFKHQISCNDAGIIDTWFAGGIGIVSFLSLNYAGMMDSKLNNYIIKTAIIDNTNSIKINSFQLYQNYPNPFNSTTIISYFLLNPNLVTIKLYDILGQEVLSLVDEYKNKGHHYFVFNASQIPTGTYFYRLNINNYNISIKKIIYLK
jgi:hypothetical protein